MSKPRVNTKCVANAYTGKDERIIEFSSENGGGLIQFMERQDGSLHVHLYRLDPTVKVTFNHDRGCTVDSYHATAKPIPDPLSARNLAKYGLRRGAYDGATCRRFVLFETGHCNGEAIETRSEFDVKADRDIATSNALAKRLTFLRDVCRKLGHAGYRDELSAAERMESLSWLATGNSPKRVAEYVKNMRYA